MLKGPIPELKGRVWRIRSQKNPDDFFFVDILRLEELDVICYSGSNGVVGQKQKLKIHWKDGQTEKGRVYKKIYPFHNGLGHPNVSEVAINTIDKLYMKNGDQKETWSFNSDLHNSERVYEDFAPIASYLSIWDQTLSNTNSWSWKAYKAAWYQSNNTGGLDIASKRFFPSCVKKFTRKRGDQIEHFYTDYRDAFPLLAPYKMNSEVVGRALRLDPFQIAVNYVDSD